ncbi:hypothetical protein QAD02_005824 [Eretmocerus hayati]|uniref:Uncharacterized protein n=1 Tax=Eretmocerus hayati TaxID=131215 RepID=A0ACC2NWG9_9HYME|nr:hypothetical protein QAD02_005824 [Eretmocerus hayati]
MELLVRLSLRCESGAEDDRDSTETAASLWRKLTRSLARHAISSLVAASSRIPDPDSRDHCVRNETMHEVRPIDTPRRRGWCTFRGVNRASSSSGELWKWMR